jgi:hypothetical protein
VVFLGIHQQNGQKKILLDLLGQLELTARIGRKLLLMLGLRMNNSVVPEVSFYSINFKDIVGMKNFLIFSNHTKETCQEKSYQMTQMHLLIPTLLQRKREREIINAGQRKFQQNKKYLISITSTQMAL